MEYIIITGASQGLGNALAKTIIGKDKILLLVARDECKLIELKDELLATYQQQSFIYSYDLSNLEQAKLLVSELISQIEKSEGWRITLINNAGTIHPIKTVDELKKEDISSSMTVNTMAPMFIISELMEHTEYNKKELRVINISSGAYQNPVEGWSLYCASKAAIQMFIEVSILENINNSRIKIVSIDPGIMNTGMQESIRSATSKGFKKKDTFLSLFRENKLRNTKQVAQIIKENFIDDWNLDSSFIKLNQFFEGK